MAVPKLRHGSSLTALAVLQASAPDCSLYYQLTRLRVSVSPWPVGVEERYYLSALPTAGPELWGDDMTTDSDEDSYWELVEPYWEAVDIYGDPDEFLATYSLVPRPNALLLAAHWCQSEVCNGGFHQFFTNSTGVLAPEALEGFETIGRSDLAKLLREAMAYFGPSFPRDQESRCVALEKLQGDRREDWDPFFGNDNAFYECLARETFETAADRYARKTKGE